jgi:Ca2+-binding EF-hand superfamily protein
VLIPCSSQSSLLSPGQLAQLRTLFDRADKTGAGSLSASQVAGLLRLACGRSGSSAVSELAIRDLLTEVDVSADGGEGRADFEEFVHLFARAFDEPTAAESNGGAFLGTTELNELKGVFKALDLDQDQLLSPTDLQRVFASIGDVYRLEEVEQMVREVDSTRTGRIKLADFLAAMSPA